MNNMKKWWIAASVAEIRTLAVMADTARGYISQIASGRRVGSADIAGRLVDAMDIIRRNRSDESPSLPIVTRGDICPACIECPHFKDRK